MTRGHTKLKAYEEETRIVDENGKEKRIIRKSLRTVQNDEDQYLKMYLTLLLVLQHVNVNCIGLLAQILQRLPYASSEEGCLVRILPDDKQKICTELNINNATYYRQLKELLRVGILGCEPNKRGQCNLQKLYVNPNLFGKGDWNSIKELRLHVKLTPNQTMLAVTTTDTEGRRLPGDKVFESNAWTWENDPKSVVETKLIHDENPLEAQRAETAVAAAIKSSIKPKPTEQAKQIASQLKEAMSE